MDGGQGNVFNFYGPVNGDIAGFVLNDDCSDTDGETDKETESEGEGRPMEFATYNAFFLPGFDNRIPT